MLITIEKAENLGELNGGSVEKRCGHSLIH